MNNRIIFGNDNAEHDEMLFKCKIIHDDFMPYQHRIIVGKWGTGKSAQLLITASQLAKKDISVKELNDSPWYFREKDLNFSKLSNISLDYSSNMRKFRKILEQIWYAEILRRAIVQLDDILNYNNKLTGEHWGFIKRYMKNKLFLNTLWKLLPEITAVITSIEKGNLIRGIQANLNLLFDNALYKNIQLCIDDLMKYNTKLILLIEPLETPYSELDQQVSLAQEVINALLNTFEEAFQPTPTQYMRVYIAVPQHRFKHKGLSFPQKIESYIYRLQWTKEKLRHFINQRIVGEFNEVGRFKFNRKNAWYDLFEPEIRRDSFEIPVIEDSFDYTLRFTHHRPRDLLQLTRTAVQVAAKKTGRTVFEILKGVGGIRIKGSHLREAIHSFRRNSFNLLKEEFKRGNHRLIDLLPLIYGLPARFSKDKLYKHLKEKSNSPSSDISLLWEAGIIGLEICCEKDQQRFHSILPKEAKKVDRNINGASITRGYFFEYNCDDDINDLLSKYTNENCSINFVIHPKCYDSIIGSQNIKWPIGI